MIIINFIILSCTFSILRTNIVTLHLEYYSHLRDSYFELIYIVIFQLTTLSRILFLNFFFIVLQVWTLNICFRKGYLEEYIYIGFPGGSVVKNLPAKAGDRKHRFDPWVRKIPWRKKCNPLQYSRLENSMDRGAWQATIHGAAKSWTRLKRLRTYTHTYTHTHIYFFTSYITPC